MLGNLMDEPNKFYKDIEEIIVHWKRFDPIRCHSLGIHDWDGLLPDYSKEGLLSRINELKEDIIHLIALKRDYTEPYTVFEFNLLKLALEQELYELNTFKEYTFSPLFFIRPLYVIERSFVLRNFASIDTRVSIIIKFLTNLPKFLSSAEEHLNKSLPEIYLDLSINSLIGIKNFLENKLDNFIDQATDKESIYASYHEAKKLVLTCINSFLSDLQEKFRPFLNQNYSMGKENFLTMLKKREFVTIDEHKLMKLGQDELEKNFSSLQEILMRHDSNYLENIQTDIPSSQELFPYANSVEDRLLEFLKHSDLVEIPSTEHCEIREIPESIRDFGFGIIDTPGPFDIAELRSYFYVTLPNNTWTSEQRSNYMKFFNKACFEIIAINQIWPGVYLKFIIERYETKSIISKLFSKADSMTKGYPSYIQEIMLDQKYNPWPDDKDKIITGHLLLSLLRNVRFVTAVGIHCFNMTIEEATDLFIEKSFLSKELAIMEVKRAIYQPMVINYTLGKLLIKKLKADYIQENKEHFSNKQFHDELLSYGSPPITILRQIMIKDPNLINEIL